MSDKEEEQESSASIVTPDALKGDPDSSRLMARLVDKMDAVLFAHGLSFRAEEQWNDFIVELQALIFRFYDDETGGDVDYDPDNAPDSTSTTETASEEEEDLDGDDDDNDEAAAKKHKK